MSRDWHMLRHSQPHSLLVLAFDRRFHFCFIHNPREKVRTVVKMWHTFHTYFLWDRTAGTLLLGRSWWWPLTWTGTFSIQEGQTPQPWQLPTTGDAYTRLLNPLFLRPAWFAFSVTVSRYLAQSSWPEQDWWMCSDCSPFTSTPTATSHTHPLTPASLEGGQRLPLPCSLAVNNKRHWTGSLQTPWC